MVRGQRASLVKATDLNLRGGERERSILQSGPKGGCNVGISSYMILAVCSMHLCIHRRGRGERHESQRRHVTQRDRERDVGERGGEACRGVKRGAGERWSLCWSNATLFTPAPHPHLPTHTRIHTLPANGMRKGSVQKTFFLLRATREALTAIESSMGSSGGMTDVMIMTQLRMSLKRSLEGSCSGGEGAGWW